MRMQRRACKGAHAKARIQSAQMSGARCLSGVFCLCVGFAVKVGNFPDFDCSADAEALARCQAHFSQWCIMKAPLILGNDLPNVDATTLSGARRARGTPLWCNALSVRTTSVRLCGAHTCVRFYRLRLHFAVVGNADAISINQDPLGVQGRRVAVYSPANTTLGAGTADNVAVVAACNASRPTQTWRLLNATSSGAGPLATIDAEGNQWCIDTVFFYDGSFGGFPCTAEVPTFAPESGLTGVVNTTLAGSKGWELPVIAASRCLACGCTAPLARLREVPTLPL
jgi:hypothetical protein